VKRKLRNRRPLSELAAWLAQCPHGATLRMCEAEGFDAKDVRDAARQGLVEADEHRARAKKVVPNV